MDGGAGCKRRGDRGHDEDRWYDDRRDEYRYELQRDQVVMLREKLDNIECAMFGGGTTHYSI